MDAKILKLATRLQTTVDTATRDLRAELLPQDVIDREYGAGRRSRHAGAEFADRGERRDMYSFSEARQCIEAEARKQLARLRENRTMRPDLRDELALELTRRLAEPDSPARAKVLDDLDNRARQALRGT